MKRVAAALLVTLAGPLCHAEQPSLSTVTYGLDVIHDRALTGFPIATLAIEGMRGLATIDPSIGVIEVKNRLQLRYRNQFSASYARPLDDDATGWALLIEQVTRDAARHSPEIAKSDSDLLTEAILDGFLTKLDIFSHYAGPAEARERRAARSGFGGIGVRYDVNPDFIRLTEVMPETPAEQGRLRVGDLITMIDDVSVSGLDQTVISQKLRGPIASAIKLTIRHEDGSAPSVVTLHRSLIVPPTVTSSVDQAIGMIAISSFNEKTGAGVVEAIRKIKPTVGLKGIILDLRGNYGGLLDQGVMVADQFIEQGHILTERGRHPAAAQSQDARPGDPGEGIPLVVLVDGRTASAAEILAADLQDSGHAVLVGTNSFGKGAIQTVLELPNHGEMTLTWSRFFAPSGYALHGLGVLPAICTTTDNAKASGDKPLAGGRAAPPSVFAAWRAVGPDDMAQRFHLRGHCPAADHSHDEADLAIARELLNNRDLFARALAVASPQSTASLLRSVPAIDRH